jgi:hypothetical protein
LHHGRGRRTHCDHDIANPHQHSRSPAQIVDRSDEAKAGSIAQTGGKDGAWYCVGMNDVRFKLANDMPQLQETSRGSNGASPVLINREMFDAVFLQQAEERAASTGKSHRVASCRMLARKIHRNVYNAVPVFMAVRCQMENLHFTHDQPRRQNFHH